MPSSSRPRWPARTTAVAASTLAAAVLLAALPAPVRAWDNVGHMTIAGIAWERLSPRAREAALALLRAAPADAGLAALRPSDGGPSTRDRGWFVRTATWADLVKDNRDAERRRRYNHNAWHYVDHYWRADAAGRPVPVSTLAPARENLVERIDALRATLADARRPAADRAIALAWLVHLVGDVHQPLHCESRVTDALPKGDRGGNAFLLGHTNLHALWDDAMDRAPGRRPGRSGGRGPSGEDARQARADGWADELPRQYPFARVAGAVADTSVSAWARESLGLAQRFAYPASLGDGGPSVPPEYRAQLRRVSEPQVTLAGYRLAALLERSLVPPAGTAAPAPPARRSWLSWRPSWWPR